MASLDRHALARQTQALMAYRPVVALVLMLLGVLHALALAWPFPGVSSGQASGLLQVLSLAGFALVLLHSTHAKQAFVRGWWFATAWLVACTWWLFISMHVYGGLSQGLAALAVFVLAAGLALFYATASWVFFLVCRHTTGMLPRALAFSALWLLAELRRGTFWSGFPWGAAGYAHVDSLLREWAPWVGVYGLSAISALVAMAIASAWRGTRFNTLTWRHPSTWLGVLICAALALTWTTSPLHQAAEPTASAPPGLTVTLLQGNVPQDLKFGEGVALALRDYRAALLNSTADLVVTPETALPMPSEQLPWGYWHNLQERFAQGDQAALVGIPLRAPNLAGARQYTNSVVALMPGEPGLPYHYDKHHLVPFGEYVPPMFHWFVQMMNIPLGDFARGQPVQAPLLWKGERIAPNICFEDLFGEELAMGFVDPTSSPTVMLNLSNIAWFGDTVAIDQHLHIARMRTLELGRPMLRATNTGATAVISAQGVVTRRLPSGVKGALTVSVRGVDGPPTPYARWVSAWGLWPLVLWSLLVLCGVAWFDRRASRQKQHCAP